MNEQRKRFVPQPAHDRLVAEAVANGKKFIVYHMEDLFSDNDLRRKWERENIVVDKENRLLVLRFYGDYGIDLRRARTHQQILDWVHHLLGKQIFIEHEDGCEVIARIAEILCAQAGLSIFKPGRVPVAARKANHDA